MSISQLIFMSQENTYSARSKLSENTRTEKMVDRSGKPEERNSQTRRLGLYLTNRDKWLSQSIARNWSSRTPSSS